MITRSLLLIAIAATTSIAQEPADRKAYFGDIHIHTMFSHDAFRGNVRTTPDDAYRFAKGAAIPHPAGGMIRLSGPPLDFLMVSDHAAYLGMFRGFTAPDSPNYQHPARDRGYAAIVGLADSGDPIGGKPVIRDAWQREIEAAERHNDPGRFTAFIGYEYTPGRGQRHMHRNVVFRSNNVPEAPFSRRDSLDPEDLWNWLDRLRARGIEALAVPHNMNQSDGLAFMQTDWKGKPITHEFAEKRKRNEPIAEISQKKGTSEVHPSLSPNDEWADFQIVQYYLDKVNNKDPITIFKGGYWRDALKTGLLIEDGEIGVNPFQLGAIGSSDSHLSGGSYDESAFFNNGSNSPQTRGSVYPEGGNGWQGYFTPRTATHGPGGLACVWADENSRAAIFDAMRRRETFATSGPRIRVRFFGGFDLTSTMMKAPDAVAQAYTHGVPMGGELSGAYKGAPSFYVDAIRDPRGSWLQRAQIIKGWVENGEPHERIYDVACSDGLKPDPKTNRCPENGAKVDLDDCSVTRDKGDVQLEAFWTDPEFDASQRAFYYVRVLENPTCRWSTWDAIRAGIEPNPELQATQQERAWSSPIWYQPR